MDFNDFKEEELKKILKRENFYQRRKNRKKKLCKIACPFIMISNFKPNERFRDLLHIVQSYDSNFFEIFMLFLSNIYF